MASWLAYTAPEVRNGIASDFMGHRLLSGRGAQGPRARASSRQYGGAQRARWLLRERLSSVSAEQVCGRAADFETPAVCVSRRTLGECSSCCRAEVSGGRWLSLVVWL